MTFPSDCNPNMLSMPYGEGLWLPIGSPACSLSPSIAILLLLHHPSTTNQTNQTTAPLTSKLQRFSWKNLAGIKKTKITYLFNY